MRKRVCFLLLAFIMVLGLLPSAALAAEDTAVPFSAAAGQTALAAVRAEEDYSYTDWAGTEYVVPLYVVTVPEGAEGVTLDFGEDERIAYIYGADGGYVGDCSGSADGYENYGQTGKTTAVVTGLTGYVQVQAPYDADWTFSLLYAVAFGTNDSGPAPDDGTVSLDTLLSTMAEAQKDTVPDWWWAAGLSNYAAHAGAEEIPTAAAKQAFVNTAAAAVAAADFSSNALATAILGLCALGYDPTDITAADGTRLDAVELLKNVDVAAEREGAWAYFTVPPYVLLACGQGEYETDALEAEALAFLLENEEEAGGWSTAWGADTTAMVLQGLAPYCAANEEVKAAADRAVTILSNMQGEDGGYGNASTEAMVILALTALGIDPDTDERFIKNGVSAVDSLLSRYDTQNAFGGDYYNKQGFLAAVAIAQMAGGAQSCNVFDFTALNKVPAAAEQNSGDDETGGDPDEGDEEETITVSFTLRTHLTTWIGEQEVELEEGATVADAFYQVLDGSEGFSYVDENGYISSITYDDTTWAEFDAGPNSGWKYLVNGVAPGVGMGEKELEDGDEVVWYYVTDYTEDTDNDEDVPMKPAEPEEVEFVLNFTDTDGHWALDAIGYCCEKGLMSGVSGERFAPDATLSRAMLVTILYRCAGEPDATGSSYTDVVVGSWYEAAVAWAAEEGIVSGYGDGRFGPDDAVTREQLALILMHYAGERGKAADLSAFEDAALISPWALAAMQWANSRGLVTGRTEISIAPQGALTRAEAAAVLMRYLENA